MPNFIKTAAVAVAAALACAVAGAADFSAQTIRLAHTAAVSHAHHEAALQFAKNVSERTGGKVKVEVYPAGELGDQPALAEQVTLGALDSAVVSLGNLAMYSKKLNAMTAPFLFKDYDHAHRTIDAFVMPWMNEGLAQHDAVGLSMFDYGFRQTTTKGVPVNSAADLKGVKIRTPPDDMTIAIFNALGANPAPLTFAELPTALQSGVFEAQENPLTNIYSSKLHEITKYISLTGHKYETAPLLASMAWWSSLSPEDQACVQSSADEATAFQRQTAEEKQTEVRQKLVEEGAIITEIQDRQAFIDATASVYDEYRERFPELVDTIVAEAKK